MIYGQNYFDQLVKNDLRTYDNIRQITTSQGDDYTTGCLLDYPFFKKYYKMIAIDLSKQQALHADSKAIQQISFARNLARDAGENTRMFFIIKESKKIILDFLQVTVRVL